MCEFVYSCRCGTKSRIKLYSFIDKEQKQKLTDAIRHLAEQAWDGDGTEALSLLARVLREAKKSHRDIRSVQTMLDRLNLYDEPCAVQLVKRSPSSVSYSCICTEVRQTMSIVISSCLSRLHNSQCLSEVELLHTVAAIKPFIMHFQQDAAVKSLLHELWHLSLQRSMDKLRCELSVAYPQLIHTLLDELLVVYEQEPEMLHADMNYEKLFTCMTTAASFFGVVCYLLDRNYLGQRMLQVIVTEIRSRNTSKAFLELFPGELKQYAAIMNAVVDAKDPELEQLLLSLQTDSPRSFNALVSIFPMFRHLRIKQ